MIVRVRSDRIGKADDIFENSEFQIPKRGIAPLVRFF